VEKITHPLFTKSKKTLVGNLVEAPKRLKKPNTLVAILEPRWIRPKNLVTQDLDAPKRLKKANTLVHILEPP
jgi:hypothetical protein